MLAPKTEPALLERLAKAAIALGSLAAGVAVFMALNQVVSGIPAAVIGGQEFVLTTGYLLYVGVRVAGVAAAALFYLSFGDAIANMLRRRIVSWQHLVVVIAGIAAILYVDYLLL